MNQRLTLCSLSFAGAVLIAACSSNPSVFGGSGGAGGDDTWVPTTGSTTSSSVSGSGGEAPSCKAGGLACAGFAECCSGSCANGTCSECAPEGQSCDDPGGCCGGLSCYKDKCASCEVDGEACTLASECCSNICDNGQCGACSELGAACTTNGQCCGGMRCDDGACGCGPAQHICGGACVDGAPSNGCFGSATCDPCVAPANGKATCSPSGACDFDCDPQYGKQGSACVFIGAGACVPNESEVCYAGAAGTAGVGPCRSGVRTCNAEGSAWSACEGEVLPKSEVCSDGIDNDCNGAIDDGGVDADGDGWTTCQGDCCDSSSGCSNPKLVNPGAFDYSGDGIDNDCDGAVDNGEAGCDGGLLSNSGTGQDYAKAMELCQTTTSTPALAKDKRWGVLSAGFTLASGAGIPAASSRSIRGGFGPNVSPRKGSSVAVLSNGVAAAQAAPNNVNPNYVSLVDGSSMNTTSSVPSDWLAANGGVVPDPSPGCVNPGNTTAYDSIMLTIDMRVPTNARAFSFDSTFYSSEFPEWVCSQFTDYFVALLDSSHPTTSSFPNPADKNLAFASFDGLGTYLLGTGLAREEAGLFSVCNSGPVACNTSGKEYNYSKCTGVTPLAGSGLDLASDGCGTAGAKTSTQGGATGWLTTAGNVVPGETIKLRFAIWDGADAAFGSTILIDNFKWLRATAKAGIVH